MAKDKLAEKLLASLRRYEPYRVRAYAGDDDARDIAVPQRRRRWAQVIAAIEARPWTRVEFLDRAGAVLGYCDNLEPASDVEDIGVDSRALRTRSEAEWIVSLVVKAQKEAMAYRSEETAATMAAQREVMTHMGEAVRELAAVWREQRDAAAETAEMRALAAAGDGSFNVKELLEAAPVLLQALPVIKSMLNGTKGKG